MTDTLIEIRQIPVENKKNTFDITNASIFKDPLTKPSLEIYHNLDAENLELHERAIEAFLNLAKDEDLAPLLLSYNHTVESADVQTIVDTLSSVHGTEQIVHVAQGNFLKQADRLLIGASEIIKSGQTVINNFGTEKTFHSIEEIEAGLLEIHQDMQRLQTMIEMNLDEPQKIYGSVLSALEKYMYDGKNLEEEQSKASNILVIKQSGESDFLNTINEASSNSANVTEIDLPTYAHRDGLSSRIDMANEGDRETDNIFIINGEIPKTVIIHVPSNDSFSSIKGDHYAYQYLFIDWYRLPHKDRPRVIMYTDGFKPPLYIKHSYQGFMFCSSPDELRNVVKLTNQLAKDQASELYKPDKLSVGQKEAYNNSDLREWENKTADTFQSLEHIIQRFNYRNNLFSQSRTEAASQLFKTDKNGNNSWKAWEENSDLPAKRIHTILDLGAGEGRISGALARLGYNVMGLDISSEQLNRSRERIKEEGEGLRNEKAHEGLSYHALNKLVESGKVLPEEVELSDSETEKRFLPVQGSFFELQYELNRALIEWKNRYTDIDPYAFFGESPFNEYAFSDRRDMFADVGFDVAMFNWHTFCEIGSPENQKNVLEQILNILDRGGELILEIPDRKIEPYASALKKYHSEHPDEPYGTIRDPKPEGFQGLEGEDLYPPRYFPDINELILLLKSVGYEIDPARDVQTYLVTGKDEKTGQETLTLKENFITARKSK